MSSYRYMHVCKNWSSLWSTELKSSCELRGWGFKTDILFNFRQKTPRQQKSHFYWHFCMSRTKKQTVDGDFTNKKLDGRELGTVWFHVQKQIIFKICCLFSYKNPTSQFQGHRTWGQWSPFHVEKKQTFKIKSNKNENSWKLTKTCMQEKTNPYMTWWWV